MSINILHLSDIHFDIGNWNQDRVLKAFLEDTKDFLKGENKPSLVIISGDITKSGQEAEFKTFRKHVIEPLKLATGVDDHQFVFAPGNHDVNREQVGKFNRQAFATLTSRDLVNEIIVGFDTDLGPLKGLENYRNFVQTLSSNIHSNHRALFSSHIFEFDKLKLGVVSLNSAWTAWGGPEDYGKLLIGEKQLDDAYNSIESCDTRICVLHHPVDYLREFDRMAFNHFVYERFHLLLSGHAHYSDQFMRSTPGSHCIVLQSGCLYQNREYSNSYSLISLNSAESKCEVKSRSYQDARNVFDVGNHVAKDGAANFPLILQHRDMSLKTSHVTAIDKIFESYRSHLDRSLVLSFDNPDLTFRNVFITPILSDAPEEKERIASATDNKASTLLDLNELIFDNSNYIIAGKKESGKTTLLQYIASESLSGNAAAQVRIPAYIDYVRDLQPGNEMFLRALKRQFNKYKDDNFDLLAQLKAGKITLLIDSFDYKFPKKSRALAEFFKEFPGTKAILTTEETLLGSLTEAKIELPFDFKKAYIYAFRRTNTRDLIKKICLDLSPTQEETVLNRITNGLTACHIPFTPFMISAALTIYRHEVDFVPINKATLVERFVEILLEKQNLTEKTCGLDYRGKENFLCTLVDRMIEKDIYQFDLNILEADSAEYLKKIGSDAVASTVINYFIRRKIFTLEDTHVKFKLTCFFEYFAAKRMADSGQFYKYIVSKENRSRFHSEIEYYSGLKRNDRELLDAIELASLEIYSEIGLKLDLSTFEKFKLNFSTFDSVERKELLEKLESQRTDQEKRDQMIDRSRKQFEEKDQVISKPKISNELKIDFIKNVILFGQVLKLSDLIEDREYKKEKIRRFVELVAIATLAITLLNDQILKVRIENQQATENQDGQKEYFLQTLIPFIATVILSDEWSSRHLKELYLELFETKTASLIERLFYLSLCSNYCHKEYLESSREFARSVSADSVVPEILLIQLVMKYTMQTIPVQLGNDALDLIADLKLSRMKDFNSKASNELVRNKIKEEVKRKGNFQKLLGQP